MNRLLIVSDSPALASGQGRVVRELASRFVRDGVEVVVAGWFHPGPRELPYQVVPAFKEYPERIQPILQLVQPTTVLVVGDVWDFAWLSAAKAQGAPFRLVGYLNIDRPNLPSKLEHVIDGFDRIVTTSAYGASVLNRPGITAVHHGVDRNVFKPIDPLPEINGRKTAQTFIVLFNSQNIYRKNLAVALAGFAEFAHGKSDVFCYANTQPVVVPEVGHNLADVIVEEDIQHLVAFNQHNRGPLSCAPDEMVNQLYAFSTVLLMPSAGEGFGLGFLEAMATKTVPLAPNAYSATELLNEGRGLFINGGTLFRGEYGDALCVSKDEVAVTLEEAYGLWRDGALGSCHKAGMRFAISRSWERTYEGVASALVEEKVARPRAANGLPVDAYLRTRARRLVEKYPDALGVLKIGGLGDMLQTTAVIRAAHKKHARPVVVFCNSHAEVFDGMPEVVEVVRIGEMLQDVATRSVADVFPLFLDVRYVGRAYGEAPTDFADRHRWFHDAWATSCTRLATLNMHATAIMLESFGVRGSIQPIFTPRAMVTGLPSRFLTVASGSGTLGALKSWPKDSWERLAGMLNLTGQFHSLPLIQVGGKEDPAIPGAKDARGLGLAETATILEASDGLVAVEGGMVHLAAAVGARAVVIFGPTPVKVFGYSQNINLAGDTCQPCWWSLPTWGTQTCAIGAAACVNFPTPADVVDAVRRLVGSDSIRQSGLQLHQIHTSGGSA